MNWTAAHSRQARANVVALFHHYGFPGIPMIARFEDRCLWKPSEAWLDRARQLVGEKKFREWRWYKNHGVAASWSLRENVPRCSMQIVLHGQTGSQANGTDRVIEADIDQHNPDYGAYPALAHLLRDVWGGKPDPFRVATALIARGIAMREEARP